MKLPEAISLKLFDRHGLPHAAWMTLNDEIQLTSKSETEKLVRALGLTGSHDRVVVKVDAAVSGKMKSGLMAIGPLDELGPKITEMFQRARKIDLEYEDYLVEEFIEHEREYFLAIKAVREGLQVYFSAKGGIDVEGDWGSVGSYLIPTERVLPMNWPTEELAGLIQPSSVLSFLEEALNLFVLEDATYLEINPLAQVEAGSKQVEAGKGQAMPLGIVMEVDEAAVFRHPEWEELRFKKVVVFVSSNFNSRLD